MHWSQTESSKCSCNRLSSNLSHPFTALPKRTATRAHTAHAHISCGIVALATLFFCESSLLRHNYCYTPFVYSVSLWAVALCEPSAAIKHRWPWPRGVPKPAPRQRHRGGAPSRERRHAPLSSHACAARDVMASGQGQVPADFTTPRGVTARQGHGAWGSLRGGQARTARAKNSTTASAAGKLRAHIWW